MPIYRTVSDRGLWKKYQRSAQAGQPQHFHKPQYLDKDKPVVTYSQLNLGENIRSYNNRQSNPNIRAEVIASTIPSGEISSRSEWDRRRHSESHVPKKSWASAKSAPATPRATSPSRSRRSTYISGIGSNHYPYQGTMYQQYNQDRGDDDLPPPPPSSTCLPYSGISSRPTTAASQYSNVGNYLRDSGLGGGQTYMKGPYDDQIPDDRTSFESRSLAGYSQMSSTGRGRESSVIGDYNYSGLPGNGYQYHHDDRDYIRGGYNGHNMNSYDVGATPNSKPNPFVQGSQLQQDAESVVQAFLMSEASKKSVLPGVTSDQIDSGPIHSTNPGKIEDLPSPTGPYGQMQFEHMDNGSYQADDLSYQNVQKFNPVPKTSTRTVIANLRKEFLESATNTSPTKVKSGEGKKTNKYLKTENRWQPPVKPTHDIGEPEHLSASNIHENIDTVQTFKAPEIHHAEPVTLRQDETSSSDSESTKDDVPVQDGLQPQVSSEFPSNGILESTMVPMPITVNQNVDVQQPDQEVPQFQNHIISMPDPSLPPPPPPEELMDENSDTMWRNYDDQAVTNYKVMSYKEEEENGEDLEFEGQQYVSPSKKKGANFFSSLFKRSSQGRGSQKRSSKGKGGKRRPKSEYIQSSTVENYENGSAYDDQMFHPVDDPELKMEKSKSHHDFSTTEASQQNKEFTHDPIGDAGYPNQPIYANQNVFESNVLNGHQEILNFDKKPAVGNPKIDVIEHSEEPKPTLERKRSMSKPTDLDEILKLQEQEDLERLEASKIGRTSSRQDQMLNDVTTVTNDNISDVFRNDPWFQNRPTLKTPSPNVPLKEPVRHVPIHSEIANRQSGQQPIYENYKELNMQALLKPLEPSRSKHIPSHETTQEIDIDAILGYAGEDESIELNQDQPQPPNGNYGIASEIDQIEWPKGSDEAISPNLEKEDRIEIDYDPMANFQDGKRKKKGGNFFSFGKGNKKKQRQNKYKQEPDDYIVPVEQFLSEQKDENDTLKNQFENTNYPNGYDDDIKQGETTSSPSSRDTSPEKNSKTKAVTKKKQNGGSGFGNFFKTSKRKTETFVEIVRTISSDEHNTMESKTIVTSVSTNKCNDNQDSEDNVFHDKRPSRTSSISSAKELPKPSRSNSTNKGRQSPNPRQKPKGGIKGFFRPPGVKSNKSQRPHRIGNTEPVDISHLVEDDIDSDFCEPPLATSQQIERGQNYEIENGNDLNESIFPQSAEKSYQPIEIAKDIKGDAPKKIDQIDTSNAIEIDGSDIDTIYPKSMTTELDNNEVQNITKDSINDGCSESSCSSYAGKNDDSSSVIEKKIDNDKPIHEVTKIDVPIDHLGKLDEVTPAVKKDDILHQPPFHRNEPIEMPPPSEMNMMNDRPRERGREKQKRGGSGLKGFFSGKPPSRPTSRQRRPAPNQQSDPNVRSKSLPRRRDSGGKGLSGLFSNPTLPSKRRQQSIDRIHTSTSSLPRQENEGHDLSHLEAEKKSFEQMNGAQIPNQDRSRRSSTSSQKQMKRQNSGLSGLFSTNPKLPSKRNTPTGTPSTSLVNIPSNVPPQKKPHAQRRDNKGFSGLFGSSSGPADRKSNKGMKKSTSFPISRPLEAPPQPPVSNNSSVAHSQEKSTSPEGIEKRDETQGPHQSNLMNSLYASPNRKTDTPKLDESYNENSPSNLGKAESRNSTSENNGNVSVDNNRIDLESRLSNKDVYPPSIDPSVSNLNQDSSKIVHNPKPTKQMGRRSGGFRKTTPDTTQNSISNVTNTSLSSNFNQPNQIHEETMRSKTPTQQSVMRDMFVENVNKTTSRPASQAASRRNSMSSVDQTDVQISNNFQRAAQKDGNRESFGARSSFRKPTKSTSSLGRTESYRQARGDFRTDNDDDLDEYENATKNLGPRAGNERNKKYNSLPRLGSKKRDEHSRNMTNQRGGYNGQQSNVGGPNRGPYQPRPNSRGGPPRPDDQCNVM